jgi:hypothetical protein
VIDDTDEHHATKKKLPGLEPANATLDAFDETAAATTDVMPAVPTDVVPAILERVQAITDRFVFEVIHCHCFIPCHSVALQNQKLEIDLGREIRETRETIDRHAAKLTVRLQTTPQLHRLERSNSLRAQIPIVINCIAKLPQHHLRFTHSLAILIPDTDTDSTNRNTRAAEKRDEQTNPGAPERILRRIAFQEADTTANRSAEQWRRHPHCQYPFTAAALGCEA